LATRYEELKQQCAAELAADGKVFKMGASQCVELQTLVQNHIGSKLCTDDYMALYEPNIDGFFSKFNTSVVKEFKLGQKNYRQEVGQ
jgi:hypothetical protein